ncbi:hypothetical protein DFH08DRAFT_1046344 [Mycena albidolilacea]|uniref:FAD-binding PCMH-type domain-containing protein n=1 Tax=Mycena albidolilacea TaxID=1033008 RepID=A0AAD6Z6W4_9AGAR|nr:hypothetical protein DFH08DRAFT_1046344 [Mycena albidolilacea]
MSLLLLILLQLFLTGQSTAVLFPPSNATTLSAALHACDQLQSSLGPSIVQTTGAEYLVGATNAWNLQNSQYQPTCIVFPRTSAHVQTAMEAIYAAGSHYAVQAGSHSAMKGWNTVQDGVLILFTHMKNVSYDPKTDSITLQPGVHWQEAIAALEPFGVAPVGGRVGDVGTGLLLGGGLSYLSPSQGYAADNFKALDVVLVNGEMVTATASNKYSDLFRALKGGGNRFGIVTRYELIAVHTGTKDDKAFFGGLVLYNSSATEALLKETARYTRDVNDPNAVLLVALTNLIGGELFSFAAMFYRGSELPAHIFGHFLSIPAAPCSPLDPTVCSPPPLGPLSYFDVMTTLGSQNERGFVQRYGASALDGADEDAYLAAFEHWSNFSAAFKDELSMTTLGFTPIPESQVQAGRAKGGNIIAPPRGGWAAVQLAEQFKAGVADVSPRVQRGIDLLFEQIPPSRGLPLYLSECDSQQKVFQSYGDYELLKKIYAKYDPTRFNMAHTQGPGGL